MEGENPTRRYKWFRPRQAAQYSAFLNAVNNAAIGLYNNSTGAHYLAVRGLRVMGNGQGLGAQTYNVFGHLSTLFDGQIPVVSSTPELPGKLYTQDIATSPNILGYQFSNVQNADAWWEHDFPLAVIEPGWSFVVVQESAGEITVSFLWEAIFADEMDFTW